MAEEDGASPRELIIEACRRNNTSLLTDLINSLSGSAKGPQAISALINDTVSPTGFYPLHIAASNGSYEVLDILLDQEGVETDPHTRRDERTPLHCAVEYCNSLPKEEWEEGGSGRAVVEILLDAGCDPRTRDKHKQRAVDICDPRSEEIRNVLRRAEMVLVEGAGLMEEGGKEGGDGPPSDSE
ncbi:MAG: hypothetical protein Q9159_003587 [Coniocarpon cinnabarinum]